MRGKAARWAAVANWARITPAHAGKSLNCVWCRASAWDHPRPCGERQRLTNVLYTSEGSPPPMRGKEPGGAGSRRLRGITPAHAGKSKRVSLLAVLSWDHPRPCGEKCFFSGGSDSDIGSPPPMRGKVDKRRGQRAYGGITPAHAGKRHLWYHSNTNIRDHPRPCGEKPSSGHTSASIRGSPPPMRGKASPARRVCVTPGITPAHAGKSYPAYR